MLFDIVIKCSTLIDYLLFDHKELPTAEPQNVRERRRHNTWATNVVDDPFLFVGDVCGAKNWDKDLEIK